MICQKYPNFSFSGCLFSTRQNAQASFSEYMNTLEMCTSLIFHGKKTIYYPFWLMKKVTFFLNYHMKYQVVTVKDKIVTVKDKCPTHSVQNMINLSIYKKYNSLMCQQLFLLIKCLPGNHSTS